MPFGQRQAAKTVGDKTPDKHQDRDPERYHVEIGQHDPEHIFHDAVTRNIKRTSQLCRTMVTSGEISIQAVQPEKDGDKGETAQLQRFMICLNQKKYQQEQTDSKKGDQIGGIGQWFVLET